MSSDLANLLTAITSLLSVLIAVVALTVAIRSESRAEKRFKTELELQREIAQADVKPILAIFTSEFTNNKGVVLSNAGVGTAVITNISFEKNGKKTKTLADLFELPSGVKWDNYWTFGSQHHYLVAGKSIDLVRLTASNLGGQVSSHKVGEDILQSWQAQMSGIKIKIDYQDVYGNQQKDSGRTL